MIRKTSLLRIVPTACGQAADMCTEPIHIGAAVSSRRDFSPRATRLRSMLGDCVSIATLHRDRILGAILPLHDFRYHAPAPSHRPGDGNGIVFSTDELAFDFIIEWKRNDESKADDPGWWSQTGSNRRPPACKAGALPTELWPRTGTH